MRFMVLVKATKETEAGVMPKQELLAAMGRYNEELVKAGVMQAAEGLHPSAKGARVRFSDDKRQVIDGPFAETKELIAGFWIWTVKSKQEALAWLQRCPHPMGHGEAEIELRQIFEAEDFGAEFTPELREQEERLRAQVAAQQVEPVPDPHGAIPYLTVKGAADAIGFYQRAFGAELLERMPGPDGKVMHAELKVGHARFMLTEEAPEWGALSPTTIGNSGTTSVIYVPDADATVQRAVEAGATVKMPVADQFWGDRSGAIVDPFGHKWMIATHKEDLTSEQLHQRAQAMFPCPESK